MAGGLVGDVNAVFARPGDLWREGVRRGYEAIRPWNVEQQRVARLFLEDAVREVRREFSVPDGEIVEMGIFLLQPDGRRWS